MNSYPNAPRLQKGALVGLGSATALPNVIVFQYNPETLTRSLSVQGAGADADSAEALRLKGPPLETIRLDVELDATDSLEEGKASAVGLGIHPALAALELLLYPPSPQVIANASMQRLGMIEVVPPEAPLTLFVWGGKRVLPVRIASFSVTEEAFDPDLNPIRARISLELRVLSYHDLGLASVGGALSIAHQVAKEALAAARTVGAAPAALGTAIA